MKSLDDTDLSEGSERAHGVPLRFVGKYRPMSGRVVSLGVPLPIGYAFPQARWGVFDEEGTFQKAQTGVLATWPDGSTQWLLVVFLEAESWHEKSGLYLRPLGTGVEESQARPSPRALEIESVPGGVSIETRSMRFRVTRSDDRLFTGVDGDESRWPGPLACRLLCTDVSGHQWPARVENLQVQESGPLRAIVAIGGRFGRKTGLEFSAILSFHAGSNRVRVQTTLENPRRAKHAGGYWDLGDPGSLFVRDVSLEFSTSVIRQARVEWIESPETKPIESLGDSLEIFQDSSGGENWKSRNHLNRNGVIPLSFRGYRVRSNEGESRGLRASPVVAIRWEERFVSCALEEFWQKFPSAIDVQGQRMTARLMPRQFGDLHELQAGEHSTRVTWFEVGEGGNEIWEGLSWVHASPVMIADPAWTAASGVVPFLPGREIGPRVELRSMLKAAIEGESSFFAKREAIDEYGWRNFGDMWADHEEAYAADPSPVISHYNNQYDLLFGMLVQLLASGERRWWDLADPLARHLMDIDIYHTSRDKPAYNSGLFWHTAHYHDAGLCTHRSMSRSMVGKSIAAPGGGPGNEHNYTSGLLLYYYLTGVSEAKRSVGGLANWVIAMDDGKQHVLGVLSDTPTGKASRTAVAGYHSPGRGAGNSINSLLDGWLASGDDRYLIKLEKLILRTVHPRDDIEALDLLNPEMRWSYTIYLQALARFLEVTRESPGLDELRSYVRQALLHYARWMVTEERFYLDAPEKLEYPTETWAAQELRKGTTLWLAARFAAPDERAVFRSRGTEILDRGWSSLMSFESRHCTRPLAIVLQQGYLETFTSAGQCPAEEGQLGDGAHRELDHGDRAAFVEQRTQIGEAMKAPWRLVRSLPLAMRPSRWLNVARQTWPVERVRHWFGLLR